MIRYSVEIEGVAEFSAAIDKASVEFYAANEKAMWESVLYIENEAKARVPRRTGRLFSSIESRVSHTIPAGADRMSPWAPVYWSQDLVGEVGTNVSYARDVEFGTLDHYIAGRNISAKTGQTKMLKFEAGGQTVFRPWVFHPGTRAYLFLGDALDASKEAVVGFFREARDRLVKALAD